MRGYVDSWKIYETQVFPTTESIVNLEREINTLLPIFYVHPFMMNLWDFFLLLKAIRVVWGLKIWRIKSIKAKIPLKSAVTKKRREPSPASHANFHAKTIKTSFHLSLSLSLFRSLSLSHMHTYIPTQCTQHQTHSFYLISHNKYTKTK